MSTVQSVNIFTVVFADPYFTPSNPNAASNPAISAQAARTRSSRIDPYLLQNNISFNYPITSNIQTLSSKNADHGNDPYGILFVPDLKSDQCKEKERDFVRANATRLANLPQNLEYPLVAIAPWFSPTCMLEYFRAASVNTAVRTFLVYQPGTSNAMPPVMNDVSWVLGDGGQWKSANQFPTYALDSLSGSIIAGNLSLYSGNITDAPNGSILAPMFQSTDYYVRLWATIDVETENQLPSLWVFLVIVLGMLIVVVGTTSGCMHLTQRRRRNNLRRRVINGEVDLEALGVKRLAVPRDYLEKLPLYTYSTAPDHQISDKSQPEAPAQVHNIPSPTIGADTGVKSAPLTQHSSATPPIAPPHGTSPTFSQPTCPICLDDFEPNESQVRELPCQHIFHAECIDTFLISNSSLCPMCKKSVLPVGYCPAAITNLMVRRERNIRRIRARAAANNASSASPTQPSSPTTSHPPGAFGSLGSRLGQTAIGRRVFSAPQRNQPRPPDIEMSGASAVPAPADSTAVPPSSVPEITPIAQRQTTNSEGCTGSATHNRREWARQRALALLGNRHVPNASDEEPASTSRWRRIFPGFR